MELDKIQKNLYDDIFRLVGEAIGESINSVLLDNQRAEYGKQIVSQVATQLSWSHFIIPK